MALLSPRASAALDRALRYERMIYDAAVVVHDRRCVEHLGSEACAAREAAEPPVDKAMVPGAPRLREM